MYYTLATILILLFLISWSSYKLRKNFLSRLKLSLKPNCLITRNPLLFVSQDSSPFYFSEYWNSIPHYLKEHGYIVHTLHLNPKKNLLHQWTSFLDLYPQQAFHTFFDNNSFPFFLSLAKSNKLNSQASWNWLQSPHLSSNNIPLTDSVSPLFNVYSFEKKEKPPLSIHSILLQVSLWFHSTITHQFICPQLIALPYVSNIEESHNFYLKITKQLAERDYIKNS